MKKSVKILLIVLAVLAVATVGIVIWYKKRKEEKHPSVTFEDLVLSEFNDKNALTLPENMTVGEIIKECQNVPHQTAFTVEWFRANNPDYADAEVNTVIMAGETVYYPK